NPLADSPVCFRRLAYSNRCPRYTIIQSCRTTSEEYRNASARQRSAVGTGNKKRGSGNMSHRTHTHAIVAASLVAAGLLVAQAFAGGGGGRGGARGPGGNVAPLPPGQPVTPTSHPAPLPAGMDDYKTTESCAKATVAPSRANISGLDVPAYLGVELKDDKGKL